MALTRARIGLILLALVIAGAVVAALPLGSGARQPPVRPSIQSVPWRLVKVHGRSITVSWSAGTCVLRRRLTRPTLVVRETPGTVTVSVLVHVVKANGGPCAGVGLGGILRGQLVKPLGGRHLNRGRVTDRES